MWLSNTVIVLCIFCFLHDTCQTWKHMYISYVGIDKSENNFALASQGEGVSLTVTGTDQR